MAVEDKFAPTDEELEYFNTSVEENQIEAPVSRARSLVSALPRGAMDFLVEEGDKAGSFIKDLMYKIPYVGPQMEEMDVRMEHQMPELFPTTEEKLQRNRELLPVQEGRFVESALQRGGPIALLGLLTGGAGAAAEGAAATEIGPILGQLARGVASGFAGEAAKELGGGPIIQALAEAGPQLAPSLLKRIPLKGNEKRLADFAREMGMTEEEIAVSLEKGGLKDELAMKLASKGGKVTRIYDSAYKKLGNIWDNLKSSYGGTTPLKPVDSSRLINKMSNKMAKNVPAEVRNRIQQDFNDFIGTEMTGENLMDFWKKLNYYIEKGDRVLGTLKSDLAIAAEQISPEFGRDFKLANKLYSNFKGSATKMKPDIADKLVGYGEAGMVVKGLVDRDLGLMKAALGSIGGRKLAQELAVNPRLQRLTNRFSQAVNTNKVNIAKILYNQIQDTIGKSDAEAARKLSEVDIDEFFRAAKED